MLNLYFMEMNVDIKLIIYCEVFKFGCVEYILIFDWGELCVKVKKLIVFKLLL